MNIQSNVGALQESSTQTAFSVDRYINPKGLQTLEEELNHLNQLRAKRRILTTQLSCPIIPISTSLQPGLKEVQYSPKAPKSLYSQKNENIPIPSHPKPLEKSSSFTEALRPTPLVSLKKDEQDKDVRHSSPRPISPPRSSKINPRVCIDDEQKDTLSRPKQPQSRSYSENCISLSPKTGRALIAKVKSFDKSDDIPECVDKQQEKPPLHIRRFSETIPQPQNSPVANKPENINPGVSSSYSFGLENRLKLEKPARSNYKKPIGNINIRTKGKVMSAISAFENSQKTSPVLKSDEPIIKSLRSLDLKEKSTGSINKEKIQLNLDNAPKHHIQAPFPICSEPQSKQEDNPYALHQTSPPISPPSTPGLKNEKNHDSLERKSSYLPLLSPRPFQDIQSLDPLMLDTLFPTAGHGKGLRRVSFSPIVTTIPQLASDTDSAFSSVSSGKSIESISGCSAPKPNETRQSIESTHSFWKAFSTEMSLENTVSETQKYIPCPQKPITVQQVFQQLVQIPLKTTPKDTSKEPKNKMNLWKRYRGGLDKINPQSEPQQAQKMPPIQVKVPSLVHRTKSRPKKPSSFRKNHRFHVSGVAMPPAAARPDWREKVKEN
ncbi:hypothetical protein CLU79DRAFT_725479 [Phycomyces nitens]|nr:hypothetical protein CLU79DRAFT_725479 [Phycomyces nitens]